MVTPTLKNKSIRLPAEWETQSGILLAWPHDDGYWQPVLSQAEKMFAALIEKIAEDETVIVVCRDKNQTENYLKSKQVLSPRIRLFEMPINDVWARDFGPISVMHNEKPTVLNFTFNAWGNKYDMPLDRMICENLNRAGAFGQNTFNKIDLVLEGGSLECDGQGTLLTTKQCLLNANRNSAFSQTDLETELKTHLGITRVLWLNHGYLCGDDTDAHIDTLARFCDTNTICYQSCDDENDEHYHDLKLMAEELKSFKTIDGQPYHLVPLPWPKPKLSQLTQDRLPASYANFLITNTKVLVPTYQDPADNQALAILTKCFPNRRVMGIDSLTFIENFGSIHCLTMQLPRGILS
jgi:agmatine deiminase